MVGEPVLVTCPFLVLLSFMVTTSSGRWGWQHGSRMSSCPRILSSTPSPLFLLLLSLPIHHLASRFLPFFMLCPIFRSLVCPSPIHLGSSPPSAMSLPYFPFLSISLFPEHLLISLTPWYLSLTDKVTKCILKVAGKCLRRRVHVGMDWSWPVTSLRHIC